MASNIDMSLDEIIKKTKGVRGRGRGRSQTRGTRTRGRGSRGTSRGTTRRGGIVKYSAQTKSPRGSTRSRGRARGTSFGRTPTTLVSPGGSTKLFITNLDFNVTDSDIQDLYSEFGNMKSARVHFDSAGRSLGTADVIYTTRASAMKAYQRYNSVLLDGRPMTITIETSGGGQGAPVTSRLGGRQNTSGRGGRFQGTRGRGAKSPRARGTSRGRGATRGGAARGGTPRGRGGRGRGGRTAKTQEQLDADLAAYTSGMDIN